MNRVLIPYLIAESAVSNEAQSKTWVSVSVAVIGVVGTVGAAFIGLVAAVGAALINQPSRSAGLSPSTSSMMASATKHKKPTLSDILAAGVTLEGTWQSTTDTASGFAELKVDERIGDEVKGTWVNFRKNDKGERRVLYQSKFVGNVVNRSQFTMWDDPGDNDSSIRQFLVQKRNLVCTTISGSKGDKKPLLVKLEIPDLELD